MRDTVACGPPVERQRDRLTRWDSRFKRRGGVARDETLVGSGVRLYPSAAYPVQAARAAGSLDGSMAETQNGILAGVASYYEATVRQFGATARGVDWNGEESQVRRFEQLFDAAPDGRFSLNDLGCGYGALLDHIKSRGLDVDYRGIDVAEEMIAVAQATHPGARFTVGAVPSEPADLTVASGIFSVRLETSDEDWWRHIRDTLDVMHASSRIAFAFNCLTSFSDAERMRPYLYYADPGMVLDYCLGRFGRRVSLNHDYGLYEFTVTVRIS